MGLKVVENSIHAAVRESGEGAYAVDIEVSGYRLKGDEAVTSGGGGLGPAPYDMLLAALGECTAMTVRWYALRQGWPLDSVEVHLTHRKAAVDGKPGKTDFFTKEITLTGDSLSYAQREKLLEVAGRCPVQRTLEGTPSITTAARAGSLPPPY